MRMGDRNPLGFACAHPNLQRKALTCILLQQ